jgi:hypothetical protein
MATCAPVCDTCIHYAFNGDATGAYTGDGRCEHPEHPRQSDPENACADFSCSCGREKTGD